MLDCCYDFVSLKYSATNFDKSSAILLVQGTSDNIQILNLDPFAELDERSLDVCQGKSAFSSYANRYANHVAQHLLVHLE